MANSIVADGEAVTTLRLFAALTTPILGTGEKKSM